MKTFAERLVWLRETAGLTRPELEELAAPRLTAGHVWLIEHGKRKAPSSDVVARIAAVFGATDKARASIAFWLTSGGGERPAERTVRMAAQSAKDRPHQATGSD